MPSWPLVRRSASARLVLAVALLSLLAACGLGAQAPQADRTGGPAATSSRTSFDSALYDRLPASVRGQGVIRVATVASYAPASFFDEDGRTIIGFEPDLAAALGRVLGVELAFVPMDFRDALPALHAGEVDIVMAAMTDTPERQQQADFIAYFSAGTSILVQQGNPHSISDPDDLCGHVVAAEEGTVQVDLIDRTQPSCGPRPIEVRLFADNDSALVELRTGRAAAVLNDHPVAAALTTDERTRGEFQLASSVQYEPGLFGIAVRKDQPRLRDALREALARLVRSGDYVEILEKWGVQSGAVEQPYLNGGA